MIDWSTVITVDAKQAEKEANLRAQRDKAISDSDWLVLRHRDELDAALATTLSDEEYVELLAHRRALREWPTVQGWADTPMPKPTNMRT
ncbi:hypothetical protein ACSZOB_03395 [Aeromonas veronii]